jgi:hypothetical protein
LAVATCPAEASIPEINPFSAQIGSILSGIKIPAIIPLIYPMIDYPKED